MFDDSPPVDNKLEKNDDRKRSGSDTDKEIAKLATGDNMKKNVGVFHDGDVEAWDVHQSELGKVSEGYALVSTKEGWAQMSGTKHNDWLGCCLIWAH
jgi:hypothetical protein